MKLVKTLIKKVFRLLGFEISRIPIVQIGPREVAVNKGTRKIETFFYSLVNAVNG
jgi:Na+-driven multidrug efflux pump